MLKKNLVSFEPTTFSQKLNLNLPKTNSHFNRFYLELDSTRIKFAELEPEPEYYFKQFDFLFGVRINAKIFLRASRLEFKNKI